MTTTNLYTSLKTNVASIADIQNAIDCNNTIADYLSIASNYHIEAAMHHGNAEHEKAAQSILKATGILLLVENLQRENLINHATITHYL